MALTQAQLEAQFVQHQQSEANHIVALIQNIVDGRLNIHEVDFDALQAKVNSINSLLDGDETSEGFQQFIDLTQRLAAVETQNAAQQTAIDGLVASLTSQIATVNARIDQVESDAQAARALVEGRVSTLEATVTSEAATRLAKDNEHDGKLANHETRIAANEAKNVAQDTRLGDLEASQTVQDGKIGTLEATATNLENVLTSEAAARVAADQANNDAIVVERGRVDALSAQAQTFATRQNVADAGLGGSNSFCSALWAAAGVAMPSGLPMPDGTTSA